MSTLYRYLPTGGQEAAYLDENDLYDPETIRRHWSNHFSELGNCQADEKKAKAGEKLKEIATLEIGGKKETREVEVTRVVTFVKKVGIKGGPDEGQLDEARRAAAAEIEDSIGLEGSEARSFIESLKGKLSDLPPEERVEAWRQASEAARQEFEGRVLASADPVRKRLLDAAPALLSLLKRMATVGSAALEHPCEVNFTALQIAVNDTVEAVQRTEGEWPEAPETPAWQAGDKLPAAADVTQPTPGPFVVSEEPYGYGTRLYIKSAEGQYLAQMLYPENKIDPASPTAIRMTANARLFAAAPRMLAALEAVVEWAEGWEGACPFCAGTNGERGSIHESACPWPGIRQAVAEATGEESRTRNEE